MKVFVRNLADVFDWITILAICVSVYLVCEAWRLIAVGPEFIPLAMMALAIPALPYLLAATLHRIWRRMP